MQTLIIKTQWLICLLFIVLTLSPGILDAQDTGRVSNIRFETRDTNVTISYDLAGPVDAEYTIVVSLRKEGDAAFRYAPKDLRGDVGTGRSAGRNKKIIWNISREFPNGLEGTDYYFEISTEEASLSSHFGWLIGAGAAVVGASIVAAVLLSSHDNASPAAELSGFAPPPGRPK